MKRTPLAVAFVLLAILAFQWFGWSPALTVVESSNGTPGSHSFTPFERPDLLARLDNEDARDNYLSIIERPLFRPDRRPEPRPDEQSDDGGVESVELSTLDLSAVLITPDLVSAWVREPSRDRMRRLRVGDDLLGWSVLDIQEDRVLLERQGRQDTLLLRDYSKALPAAAPSPAGRAPPRLPPRLPVRSEPPKP